MPQQQNEEPPGNGFAIVLGQVSHGDLSSQASETLAELVRRVHETGKSGSMTLKIEIKPRGRDSGQVEVNGKVDPKYPVPDVAPSMFFATEEGELKRDNPLQGKLPFGDETPQKVASNS